MVERRHDPDPGTPGDGDPDRPSGDREYDVNFLDVGAGLCTVVDTGEEVMLFDGGPGPESELRTGPRGEDAVVDELSELGVETVDHVVVSHLDADHVDGVARVMERAADESTELDVGRFHMPDVVGLGLQPRYTPHVERLLTAVERAGMRIDPLRADADRAAGDGQRDPTAGDPAFSVGDADVHVLGPAEWPGAGREGFRKSTTAAQTSDEGSVVLYVAHDAGDGVLTGDAQSVGGHHAAVQYDLSDAEWLQMPRHGIWKSGGYLLDAADPDAVGIPGGDYPTGDGDAPSAQRLADLAARDPDTVVVTRHNGWSRFRVGPDGVETSVTRNEAEDPRSLARIHKGRSVEDHLAAEPAQMASLTVQAAERAASGRVPDVDADGPTPESGFELGSRLGGVLDDDAVRATVHDAITDYVESGDDAALVGSVADAVRDEDEAVARTFDAMAASERLIDDIERRDEPTQATRDAVEAVDDHALVDVAEARERVQNGRTEDGDDPRRVVEYLKRAATLREEVEETDAVDSEDVSVDGTVDLVGG